MHLSICFRGVPKCYKKAMDNFISDNADTHQEIIKTITEALYENNVKGRVFRWHKNLYRLYLRIKSNKNKNQLDSQSEALESTHFSQHYRRMLCRAWCHPPTLSA